VLATPNNRSTVLEAREYRWPYQSDLRFYTRVLRLYPALSNTLLCLDSRTSFADTVLSFALISVLPAAPAARVATATLETTRASISIRPIDPTQLWACHSLSEHERAAPRPRDLYVYLYISIHCFVVARLYKFATQLGTEPTTCNHVD
jgi:hypothetical protein